MSSEILTTLERGGGVLVMEFNKKCLVAFLICALFLPLFQLEVHAQEKNGAKSRGRRPRTVKTQAPARKPGAEAGSPIALINKAVPDYLTREATVKVDPTQPTVIRLGMAQNATSVVEFPASDFVYYTHEGNPQLVAIFDSPTKETDHFITLYPGTGFVAPPPGAPSTASVLTATVTLQMQSGLVIILIIVPVADVMDNAHRCFLNYNREEVVAVRRAAGLAVNLDGKERSPNRPNAASSRIGKPGGDGGGDAATNEASNTPVRMVTDIDSTKADEKRPKKGGKPVDPTSAANKALTESVKSSKNFKKWLSSPQGLSLSLSPAVDLDEHSRLVVVAIRNDSANPLRIVPGNPEIYVQWFDEGGTPLNITEINRLHVETTSVGGRVPAGQVVYYAIVYETPILGAKQKVRVSVAQTSASDQPVAADLGAESR